MAEEPSLHIDTDWKKHAQEEKRRLAEQQEKQKSAAPPTPPMGATSGPTDSRAAPGAAARGRGARELPPPSFAALVQSMVTQVLFYLGDLTARGAEPTVNLDMAKHHIDTLGVLEEKTKGNLTDEEKRLLDAALYETRMRYVAVSSQFVS